MSKDYKMFQQIVLANTGYSENKKLYSIDCSKLDKSQINYEYTNITNFKIDIPFELIGMKGQQIKPVFDCDPKFNKNDEVNVLKTIQFTIVELDKMYPDKQKYAIMRIRNIDENTKKISYHITVDGIRTNIETIKNKLKTFGYEKDKPFDYSIYSHNRGLYSCFTNKKIDQKSNSVKNVEIFKPICLETGNILKIDDIDIRKYSPSYIEESFETDFIEPPKGPIEPKEPKKQYDDGDKDNSKLDIEEIIKHLKPFRAENRDDWLNGIYCVMNCAENLGMSKKKQKDIAHLFSSICESKYEEDLVDDWLTTNFEKKREYGYRWKFLLDWLKEDDIDYYNSIINVKKNKVLLYEDMKKDHEKRYKKIMFPPVIFDMKRGTFSNISNAEKSFAHKTCIVFSEKKNKSEKEEKGESMLFFKNWLIDPYIEVYEEMKWLPNKPQSQNGDDILNTWTGWEIENEELEDWDTFNQENDYWKWFQEFSENLWGSEEISNYILARYALRIQNPAKRSHICCIYYGKQGVGKSSFLEIIANIFGKYFIGLESASQIYENHSMCEVNKLLVCVNETKGGDNHKNSNVLKTRITEENLRVNPKGIQMYDEKNYCDYDMPTNNINVVDYSDESKRRFFQVEATNYHCPHKHPEKVEFWNNFKQNIEKDRRVHKQIFEGFKNFDIKKIVPSGNFQDEKYKPQTSIANDVKYLNRCKVLHFLTDITNMVQDEIDGEGGGDKELLKLIDTQDSGGEMITHNNKLFECFDIWCKKSKITYDMNKIVFGRKIKKYADDLPEHTIRKDTNKKTFINRESFLNYITSL